MQESFDDINQNYFPNRKRDREVEKEKKNFENNCRKTKCFLNYHKVFVVDIKNQFMNVKFEPPKKSYPIESSIFEIPKNIQNASDTNIFQNESFENEEENKIPTYTYEMLKKEKVTDLRLITEMLSGKYQIKYHWTWLQRKEDLIQLILDPKNENYTKNSF